MPIMFECQRVFLSLQIGSGRQYTQGGITTDWKWF